MPPWWRKSHEKTLGRKVTEVRRSRALTECHAAGRFSAAIRPRPSGVPKERPVWVEAIQSLVLSGSLEQGADACQARWPTLYPAPSRQFKKRLCRFQKRKTLHSYVGNSVSHSMHIV
eukprot:751993-Amphidinium_carterae.1